MSWTLPSTRTRTKPSRCTWRRVSACWPFWPRTIGAITMNRVPSGRVKMASTIWLTVCEAMGWPHTQQWGSPTRA